jgi:hypothetical protein
VETTESIVEARLPARRVGAGAEDPLALALRQAIGLRLAVDWPWLVLRAGPVCKYIDHPTLAAVPNVQSWFVGVHSEEGVLAPVFDVLKWSDAASDGLCAGSPLTLISDASLHVGLLCPEPPVILSVMLDQQGPTLPESLPPALAACLGPGLHTDLGAAFAFDPFAWFRQVSSAVVRPG